MKIKVLNVKAVTVPMIIEGDSLEECLDIFYEKTEWDEDYDIIEAEGLSEEE